MSEAYWQDPEHPWPGFMLTFPNDWSVSVQWGTGHHCDKGETTAEVAIWDSNGLWYAFNKMDRSLHTPNGDYPYSHRDHHGVYPANHTAASVVNEYIKADTLALLMDTVASQGKKEKEENND